MSELTPRQQRIEAIMEAIDELCKAHAEHAVEWHDRSDPNHWPSERDLNLARENLAETLEENL